jgi:hypothetical protein
MLQIIMEAAERYDWRVVLSYEGRLEEVLERDSDEDGDSALSLFGFAHTMLMSERHSREESQEHAARSAVLEERRIEILGRWVALGCRDARMPQ